MQTPIVTLTLNPALDLSSEVAALIPDTKLRCTAPLLDPGGGGLNVSRAIAAMGGESLALVALARRVCSAFTFSKEHSEAPTSSHRRAAVTAPIQFGGGYAWYDVLGITPLPTASLNATFVPVSLFVFVAIYDEYSFFQ